MKGDGEYDMKDSVGGGGRDVGAKNGINFVICSTDNISDVIDTVHM